MTYLLVGYKNKPDYLRVYSPETYGSATWGNGWSQDSLEKKRKNWYFTSWTNGGEHEDDTYDEVKAHVLVETTDPDEILRWLDAAYRNKNVTDDIRLKEIMKNILGQIEEIFKDWLDIERWMLD